jgi:hypothetical protein
MACKYSMYTQTVHIVVIPTCTCQALKAQDSGTWKWTTDLPINRNTPLYEVYYEYQAALPSAYIYNPKCIIVQYSSPDLRSGPIVVFLPHILAVHRKSADDAAVD